MSWVLTSEAFDQFLVALDPDRERAGERYEQIRLTLVKFFEWSGALVPEECADETLNRVCRKLAEGEEIRDIVQYCKGVARFVHLNFRQDPLNKRTEFDDLPPLIALPDADQAIDLRQECFEACLQKLPAESRELITQYYQAEKRAKIDHRKELAERLGIPVNALRIRSCRIRTKLEDCINHCLKKSAAGVK